MQNENENEKEIPPYILDLVDSFILPNCDKIECDGLKVHCWIYFLNGPPTGGAYGICAICGKHQDD